MKRQNWLLPTTSSNHHLYVLSFWISKDLFGIHRAPSLIIQAPSRAIPMPIDVSCNSSSMNDFYVYVVRKCWGKLSFLCNLSNSCEICFSFSQKKLDLVCIWLVKTDNMFNHISKAFSFLSILFTKHIATYAFFSRNI